MALEHLAEDAARNEDGTHGTPRQHQIPQQLALLALLGLLLDTCHLVAYLHDLCFRRVGHVAHIDGVEVHVCLLRPHSQGRQHQQ